MSRAPAACSLSAGEAARRAEEFRELARRALAGRERGEAEVRLRFHAGPGVTEAVEDLARRERDCCPFLDLRVERSPGEVTLAIGAAPEDAAALDAFYELAA